MSLFINDVILEDAMMMSFIYQVMGGESPKSSFITMGEGGGVI